MNVPLSVGVPLIVIVLEAQAAVTPAGNPVAVPIPVANVVACVMLVKAVLIHKVGVVEAAAAVILGVTVTTVAALVAVHPLRSVCITVYEPDVVNVAFLAVAPLLHMYDPTTLADDFKVTVPPVQKVVVLLGATEVIEIDGVGKA